MDTGEKTILKTHPHWLGYFRFYFLSLIFIVIGLIYYLPLIILGIVILFFTEVVRRATTYYVLESGVAHGYRFLSTSRKTALYINIQNIHVSQSFIDNIFGIGNVSFDTSGSDLVEVHFEGVSNPYKIERIVREKMSIK